MFPAAVWVEASRVSGGLCRVAMATPARFRCRCSRPQRPPSGRLLAGFCCCYHPPAFAAARPRSFLLKTTNERLRAQPACQRQSAAHTFVSSVAYASGARARASSAAYASGARADAPSKLPQPQVSPDFFFAAAPRRGEKQTPFPLLQPQVQAGESGNGKTRRPLSLFVFTV